MLHHNMWLINCGTTVVFCGENMFGMDAKTQRRRLKRPLLVKCIESTHIPIALPYRNLVHPVEWFYHEVVVKDGRVYNTLTGPNGLPIDDSKNEWEHSDAINFGF